MSYEVRKLGFLQETISQANKNNPTVLKEDILKKTTL